jgi:hypothetical protein
LLEICDDLTRDPPEFIEIEWLKRLADNPMSHRVNVSPDRMEAESVCLVNRRPTAHERIGDDTATPVRLPVARHQWLVIRKFR